VQGWKPSTYSRELHAELTFPLDGRHLEAECAACHGPVRADLDPLPGEDVLGTAGVALTVIERQCVECHHDPHRGRFAADGVRPVEAGCRGCHGADSFSPPSVTVESHARYDYPLEGAHRAVPCVLCHRELEAPPSEIHLLRVTGEPRELTLEAKHERCEDCHTGPHGEQFAYRADRGSCAACHRVETWGPATGFDHERDAAFPLEGGHRDVACQRCHALALDDEGRPTVIYRPLPHRCRDCHGRRSTPDLDALDR
jgi:hypothetical protein